MKVNSQKFLIQVVTSLLIILYLGTSCTDAPTYSKVPKIALISMEHGSESQNSDTVNLTISFQDGDGDLGLDFDEREGIFADSIPMIDQNGDTIGNEFNRFHFNYFIDTYKLVEGEYQKIDLLKDGRFPPLNRTQGSSVMEGELLYALYIIYNITDLKSGDVIKFEISIADKALNVSNIVETDSIVLGSSL